MASLLADIQTKWNSTLALSSLGYLWLTSAPDNQPYPYFVVNELSQNPTWTTGDPYFETASIQIDAYGPSAANISTYLQTIKGVFDWVKFSSTVIACYRENSFILQDAAKVFHGTVLYTVLSQRSVVAPVGIA